VAQHGPLPVWHESDGVNMIIKGVLFNKDNRKLGTLGVPEDCAIVQYGGSYFVQTDTLVVMSDGAKGYAYDQTNIYCPKELDK